MADPFRLTFDVWAAARPPLARHLPAPDIEATDELLADRNGAATPRIMVFGTYNAGKSTLINAFVGEEVARVADHPETACVTSYPWRGFLLDDTPGIDAPIEHEQVTRKHLDTADVVLFVLATDGTLEEQRSFDEIVALVQVDKPIRVILNNKSGFRPDTLDFLNLRDHLADNLRRAAVAAGIEDIETRAPIRLVNAASALRSRREGKPGLLASSGLLELEADIAELCEKTGKADMARTVCRRISKQIDLVLNGLPTDKAMAPFNEASDAIAAERARLTAVLEHAAQEAGVSFQAALTQAVSRGDPNLGPAAVNEAADAVTSIIERELRKTQRVFADIESAFVGQAVPIHPVSGSGITLPTGSVRADASNGGRFNFSDAVNLLSPATSMLDSKAIVGGFMAVKQVFPATFKGLGPAFFGRIAPIIGPAIQVVTGIYSTFSAHREAQREFAREKDLRLALQQQIEDAGRKMRWALSQQCHGVIESVFAPVEDSFGRQAAALKGESKMLEADRTLLLKCKGRINIATSH